MSKKDLLKAIPNYAKNVGKSVMYSSGKMIEDISPEVAEFAKSSASVTQAAISESKKYSVNFQTYIKNFENSQTMKDLKRAKSDLISDLKTGNFNNQGRINSRAGEAADATDAQMMGDLGFDFDDSDGDVDDEAILKKMMGEAGSSVDSDSGDTVVNVNNVKVNNVSGGNTGAMLTGIARSSRMTAQVMAGSANMIVENQNTIYGVQAVNNERMFSEVSERLSEMTGYLKGLFEYTENITNHMKASAEYYDRSIEGYDAIVGLGTQIVDLTKKINNINDDEDEGDRPLTSKAVFGKSFNTKKYIEHVKGNFSKELEKTGITSMLGFADTMSETAGNTTLGTMLQNPARFISDAIAKKTIINPIKENLSEFSNVFSSFFKGASLKGMGIADEKDNPLLNIASKIFGVKADDARTVGDLDAYKATSGFGINQQLALTEVIPTYLRKMLKVMSGAKSEYVYDYTSQRFNTLSEMEETKDKNILSAKRDPMYRLMSKIDTKIESMGKDSSLNTSKEDRVAIKNTTRKFFDYLADEEKFFDPENDKYEKHKDSGLSKDEFSLVSNLVKSTGVQNYIKLNDMVYNVRDSANSNADNFNKNAFDTGNSALFNGFYDQTGTVNTDSSLSDKLNLSVTDYLSDIKNILLEGIMVYNLPSKKNASKNTSAPSEDFSTRLNAYRAQIKQIDDSQSSKAPEPTSVNTGIMKGLADLSPGEINALTEVKDGEGDNVVEVPSTTNSSPLSRLLTLPHRMMNSSIKSVTKGMLTVLYGKQGSLPSGANIFETMQNKVKDAVDKTKDFFTTKIMEPLENKLFGDNGIFTKLDAWLSTKVESAGAWLKGKLFGENGERGLLSGAVDKGKDLFGLAKHKLTGAGYTDTKGNVTDAVEDQGLFSRVGKYFKDKKDKIQVSLFGGEDEEGVKKTGFMTTIKDKVTSAFGSFKEKYLGDDTKDNLKEAMPKVLSGAGIGAGVSLFSSMFLPFGLGILPSLLLGGATGFASSSDKFKNYLFGEDGALGANGPKLKGAIDKYGKNTLKGTGIGAALGVLTGNPLLGIMLGSSVGFATKSEKVKEFLFGTEGDDSNAIIKQKTLEKMKKAIPGAAAIGAGTFLYSNLGFFGSSLLPGGIIGSAMFGFASSMALQSESVQRFLFGEKDANGEIVKDGVMGKVKNWFRYSFVETAKLGMWKMFNGFGLWFRDKIGNNLMKAFKPMYEQIKLTGKNFAKSIGNQFNKVFEKTIGKPVGEFLQKNLLDPMKGVFGKLFKGMKGLIEMPFNAIGGMGDRLAAKHKEKGLDYVDAHLKGVADRDAKVKSDAEAFKIKSDDRSQKLGVIQTALKAGGYDSGNKITKDAIYDYNNNYSGSKWQDIALDQYKSIDNIDIETSKQTGILDSIFDIAEVVKDDFTILVDNLKTYLPDSDTLKSKLPSSKSKDDTPANPVVSSTETESDNTETPVDLPTSNPMAAILNPIGFVATSMGKVIPGASNIMNNIKSFFPTTPSKTGPETEAPANNEETKPAEKVVDIAPQKTEDAPNPEAKVVDTPKPDEKEPHEKAPKKKDLQSIKRHVAAIDREISGQLDGVGWNLDSIRKILIEFTGVDHDGENLKRGNKKRNIFSRIKNFMMRPFDFIKDKVSNAFDNILKPIKSVFGGLGKTIKFGASLFKTAFETTGKILVEGTKALGGVLVSGTKFLGKTLSGLVEGAGTLLKGVTEGLGSALGGIVSGLGTLAGGLTSATGHVISGLGALSSGLMKATGTIISGTAKAVKGLAGSLFKGVKSLAKGAMSAIAAPVKGIAKMTGKSLAKPVKIDNWTQLANQSKRNPLHVILADSKGKGKNNKNNKEEPEEEKLTLGQRLKAKASGFASNVSNKKKALGEYISNTKVSDHFKGMGTGLANAYNDTKGKVVGNYNKAKEVVGTNVTNAKNSLIDTGHKISDKAHDVGDTIKLTGMYAGDAITSAKESVQLAGMYAGDKIKSGIETAQIAGMYAKDKVVDLKETAQIAGMYAQDAITDTYDTAKDKFSEAGKSIVDYVDKRLKAAGVETVDADVVDTSSVSEEGSEGSENVVNIPVSDFKVDGESVSKGGAKGDPSKEASKILANANNEIANYKEKIVNTENYNFGKDSEAVSDTNPAVTQSVMANAVAQTNASSKGTFSLLASMTGKKSLFGKLLPMLLLGLPKIMKFFKNTFSIKGITKLFSGIFGKGGLIAKLFGGLFGKNSLIGKGIGAITGLFSKDGKIGSKIKDGIDKIKESKAGKKVGETKDKVVNFAKEKGGKALGFLKTKSLSGLTKVSNSKVGNKKNGTKSLIGKGSDKLAGLLSKKKGKKAGALGAVASLAGDIITGGDDEGGAEGAVQPNVDLSNIKDAVVINGNAVIQVNGSVINGAGGSGGNAGDDGSGGGIMDDVLGIAEDVASKGKGKKGILGKASKFLSGKGGKFLKAGGAAAAGAGLLSIIRGDSDQHSEERFVKDTVKGTAKNLAKGAAEATTNVVANVAEGATSIATNATSAVANVAEGAGSATGGFMNAIKNSVDNILKSDFFTKGLGKHLEFIPKIGKWVLEKFAKIGGKKIAELAAKLTAKATAMTGGAAVSFGLIPAAFLGWDAVTGAFEARNIFKLGPDADVTMGMRTATGIAKLIDGNLTFGFIDIGDIANFIYGLIGKDSNVTALHANQAKFEEEYNKYASAAQAKGEEVQSMDEWNNKQNRTVFGKAVDGVKAVGKGIGGAFKKGYNWLTGKGDDDKSKEGEVVDVNGGSGKPEEEEGFFSKLNKGALALGGGIAGVTGITKLVSKLKGPNKTALDSTGSIVGQDNMEGVMLRDASLIVGDYNKQYGSLKDQIGKVDGIRKQSEKLIETSAKSADMALNKAGDAIKSTTSLYGNVAASAMGSTATMASLNTGVAGTAHTASAGAAPAPAAAPTSLWDTVKNIGSSITKGISGIFGFGGGNGDDDATPVPQGMGIEHAQPIGPAPAASSVPGQVPGAEYMHGMVYYNQRENPWGPVQYSATGDSKQTIATSGCGPTSAAMVLSSLTGKYITPVDASKWALANGFRTPNSGTSHGFFDAYAKTFGMRLQSQPVDKNIVQQALRNRQPIVMSGSGGHPYTKYGHFIAAAGITPDGNNVIVNDPNYRDRSIQYPIQKLLSQTKGMWVANKSLTTPGDFTVGGAQTGVMPNGASSMPGATAPQPMNSPMDVLSRLGQIIGDATGSIFMGKAYTGDLLPSAPGGVATGPGMTGGGFTGTGSLNYSGPTGTQPLAATYNADQYGGLFDKEGNKYGVDPGILKAFSMQESSGKVQAGYTNRPAWGLMQIEHTLGEEFAKYGQENAGQSYTLQDRIVPDKAVPFGAYKFSSLVKHYDGDYMKALQGYNFSHYSLDKLIKAHPNDWMQNRDKIAMYNGHYKRTGSMSYGDPKYIEHVMRYYHGTPAASTSSVPKAESNAGGTSGGLVGTKSSVSPGKARWSSSPTTTSVKTIHAPRPNTNKITMRIDNALTASDAVKAGLVGGGNNVDLSQVIAYLDKIAGNTDSIADTNQKIADKDFTVNNVTSSEDATKKDTKTNTHPMNNRSVSENPFNGNTAASASMRQGYNQAKSLARM